MAHGSYPQTGRLFHSDSSLTVVESVQGAKGRAEQQRRDEAEDRINVYEDDWKDLLIRRIKQSFTPENAAEVLKVVDVTNNPLKRIIQEISTLYSKPAQWTFAEGVDGEAWAQIQEGAKAEAVFPELNRMVNLCNESGIYVAPGRDGLRYHVVTPDNIRGWQHPDDPSMPIAVAIYQGMVDTSNAEPFWHFWSSGPTDISSEPVYQKLDLDFNRVGPSFPNPYQDENGEAVLPFVLYHRRWPKGKLWDRTSGNDLFELALLMGQLETWVNHLMRTDATRQKYVIGLLDSLGQAEGGPNTMLQFRSPSGEAVSVGEFNSQSNWQGLTAVIASKLQNVLNNNGLSLSDYQLTGDAQSGFALRVRKEGLVEIRERQAPIFRCWDLELYRTVQAVWKFERQNPEHPGIQGPELPVPSAAEPAIKYSEFQTTLTVQEKQAQLDLAEKRMALGLDSPLTIYMAEHPGSTEDEAREAIAKNKADTRDIKGGRAGETAQELAQVPPPGSAPRLSDLVLQAAQRRANEQKAEEQKAEDGEPSE